MINPDHAAKWHSGIPFDKFAATVIGAIAVLSTLLGVVHTSLSLEATRANQQASRLAADISARIAIASVGGNLVYTGDEAVLMLQMEGTDRLTAAGQAGDTGARAVGQALVEAARRLGVALSATEATTGGSPSDAYVSALLLTTDAQFQAVVADQNHQLDIESNAGDHDRSAVLGLSFLALAGVLTGLAAVLREGRAGWIALRTAAGMVGLTVVMAILAMT